MPTAAATTESASSKRPASVAVAPLGGSPRALLGGSEDDAVSVKRRQVCMPRHLAKCAAELPADSAGVMGTFAVTVPTGTAAIAGDAFTKCKGLAQVTLPATVTVIQAGSSDWDGDGKGAFSGCSSLSKVVLPPNLIKIGLSAFKECTSLSEITLPPNLAEIGHSAFYGCTSLSVIVLPAGTVDVGLGAFFNCPGTPRRPGD